MSARTCSLPSCAEPAVWRVTVEVGEPVEMSLYVCRRHGQRIRAWQARGDVSVEVPGQGSVELFGPRDRIELIADPNSGAR